VFRYLLFVIAVAAQAQTGSDIFVAPVKIRKERLVVGTPVNITSRPGYDNQPSFTPDGRAILFTSIREDKQADTYRYDLKTAKTERLTRTAESEFSPTMAADGETFSAVRVEADQTQRLWRFQAGGAAPGLVLEALKPVGYFAYADVRTVVAFILGTPPTLQVADIETGKTEVVASNIGRTILRIPGRTGIGFMEKAANGVWWIEELDAKTRTIKPIVKALEGSEYFAWTPKRVLLMAKDTKLFQCDPAAGGQWEEIATLPQKISRIAVSPKGDRIAFVSDE
jgi:hypothetical protein